MCLIAPMGVSVCMCFECILGVCDARSCTVRYACIVYDGCCLSVVSSAFASVAAVASVAIAATTTVEYCYDHSIL